MSLITLNPDNQLILGSGEMTPWYKTGKLGIAIIAILFIALTFWAYMVLRKEIRLPSDVLVVMVASPNQAKSFIKDEWKDQFPDSWRDAIERDASAPCIFGLARGMDKLRPFSICEGKSQGEGLDWDQGPVVTRYQLLKDSWSHPYGEVDIRILSEIVQVTLPLQETSKVRFSIEKGRLKSTVPLVFMPGSQESSKRTGVTMPVSNADILLSFSKHTWDAIPSVPVSLFPGLPDLQRLKELPAIVQYETWLSASGTPDIRRVRFAERLSEEDAAKVLMYFGVTQRQTLTLPDGTITYERVLPKATIGSSLFKVWQNDRKEWLEIDPFMMKLAMATSSFEKIQDNQRTCEGVLPWLRLAPKVVYELLRDLDWTNAPSPEWLPTVVFGSENERLVVCSE